MTAEDQNLTDNALREIAHLTEFAADARRDPAERAAALLTAHQRRDVGSCLCGWAELGMSHALHQADVLAQARLLAATTPQHEAVPLAGYVLRDYNDLVLTLAASRDSQGISLRALAEHTDCVPSTLSENLRGIHRMDALTALQVTHALGYTLALTPRMGARGGAEHCEHWRAVARDDYANWWNDNTDAAGELLPDLPEPVRTLALHVQALQGRIDKLPDPTTVEADPRGWDTQCACSYDDPWAICAVHERREGA